MTAIDAIHTLTHRITGLDYPHGHWWVVIVAVLVFVVAPAWTAWLIGRAAIRRYGRAAAGFGAAASADAFRAAQSRRRQPGGVELPSGRRLEAYVLGATFGIQIRLVLLSVATLPAAWLILEIPKHIINHALTDAEGDGLPGMTFLGLPFDRTELLFALCAGYLAVLTLNGLLKYAANRVRGRVNERVVRRLRLAVLRRARTERSTERRTMLAAVAVQEVEPIGYFGGSLVAVPIVQGGVLVTSVAFLLLQDVALGLAALIMLPVQLTVMPRLQKRLNAKVRQRVLATRALGALVTTPASAGKERLPSPDSERVPAVSPLRQGMMHVEELERVRVAINDMKGGIKSLYNYTSNLTPFFFFVIGGYLVVQGRLSLGALVAALAAYKEIAPALRELFDFVQDWSDAVARYAEVTHIIGAEAAANPSGAKPAVAQGGLADRPFWLASRRPRTVRPLIFAMGVRRGAVSYGLGKDKRSRDARLPTDGAPNAFGPRLGDPVDSPLALCRASARSLTSPPTAAADRPDLENTKRTVFRTLPNTAKGTVQTKGSWNILRCPVARTLCSPITAESCSPEMPLAYAPS